MTSGNKLTAFICTAIGFFLKMVDNFSLNQKKWKYFIPFQNVAAIKFLLSFNKVNKPPFFLRQISLIKNSNSY
jgi:hypothetical protein